MLAPESAAQVLKLRAAQLLGLFGGGHGLEAQAKGRENRREEKGRASRSGGVTTAEPLPSRHLTPAQTDLYIVVLALVAFPSQEWGFALTGTARLSVFRCHT
jgi:hypothetical protein